MSTDGSPPPLPPPARSYTLGTGVMIFFGVCLLFPGLCSLYVIVAIAIERHGNPLNDPYVQPFALVWAVCFLISAIGVTMIVAARKRTRRTP
jgi:hypothetical protein